VKGWNNIVVVFDRAEARGAGRHCAGTPVGSGVEAVRARIGKPRGILRVRRVGVADNESADKDHASKQRAKVSPLGDVRIMRTRQRWRSVASVTHVYL
jgi:hypothetical protein